MRKFLLLIAFGFVAGFLLTALVAWPARAELPRDEQCRMEQRDHAHSTQHETELTVRCFGRKFNIRATALRIGWCESHLTTEHSPHSDPYHGTFQYLKRTFHHQQHQIRAQVRKYDLNRRVHNMRANIGTAVIWMSKHGTAPWSCA